jgi:hypothetical protein
MFLEKILRQIAGEFARTEEGQQNYAHYHDMQKHKGWKIYQSLVVTIANSMAQYLVSKEFSQMSPEEKDREQWAIFLSKEVIEFLLDPMRNVRFQKAVNIHNQTMEATLAGATIKRGRTK